MDDSSPGRWPVSRRRREQRRRIGNARTTCGSDSGGCEGAHSGGTVPAAAHLRGGQIHRRRVYRRRSSRCTGC